MTKLEEYTIHEIIQMIEGGEIKLPIFQRRYVWSKEQVENLFSTVFNDNPFGAISAIKTTDDYPIFASRTFFEDLKDKYQLSEYNDGQNHSKENPLYLILDGQQRLQSFYLGLTSKFDDMELCFNKQNGTFKFCAEYDKNEYISVKQLYKKLGNNTYESVAKSFNADKTEIIDKNIFKFYYHFFFQQRIVMLLAYPSGNEQEDKEKLFELFVKLNTSGVNMDIYDICISKLKAYNPLMEKLFCKLKKILEKETYSAYLRPFSSIHESAHIKSRGIEIKYLANDNGIWVIILVICFNKYKKNYFDENTKIDDDMVEISKQIKTYEDVNLLFKFIVCVYKLHYITDIFRNISDNLICNLYKIFRTNLQHIDIPEHIIISLKEELRNKFADTKSLELFVLKYLLDKHQRYSSDSNDFDFYVREEKETQHYIIQHFETIHQLGLKRFSIMDIKNNNYNTTFKFKFNHNNIENRIRKLKNEYSKICQTKEREWNNIFSTN